MGRKLTPKRHACFKPGKSQCPTRVTVMNQPLSKTFRGSLMYDDMILVYFSFDLQLNYPDLAQNSNSPRTNTNA